MIWEEEGQNMQPVVLESEPSAGLAGAIAISRALVIGSPAKEEGPAEGLVVSPAVVSSCSGDHATTSKVIRTVRCGSVRSSVSQTDRR